MQPIHHITVKLKSELNLILEDTEVYIRSTAGHFSFCIFKFYIFFFVCTCRSDGWHILVDTATCYCLDGQAIESWW
jgi:hypothetical protein